MRKLATVIAATAAGLVLAAGVASADSTSTCATTDSSALVAVQCAHVDLNVTDLLDALLD